MITVGIDLGTAAIKVVFIDKCNLLWAKAVSTTPKHNEICEKLVREGLKTLSLKNENIAGIATTGYGKSLFRNTDKIMNEISANALGAHILSGGKAKTIINIGGQDIKIMKLSSGGKVLDFKMNDKCAAGTGRFFEMAERILNVHLREFGNLSFLSQSPVSINSTCTVFAETEIVSLLSDGKKTNDIIAGLHRAIAKRIFMLGESMDLEDEIYLDGGPAVNKGLILSVKEEFMRNIGALPHPQFTVAFGAAALVS